MFRTSAAIGASLLGAAAALAQTAPSPPLFDLPDAVFRPVNRFTHDGSRPIAERHFAGDGKQGLRMGGFLFYPSVLTRLVVDDNLYATPGQRVSDMVTHFQPAFLLRSDWSVHALEAYGAADRALHAQHSREDRLDGAIGFRGVVEAQRAFKIGYFAGWRRVNEDRASGEAILAGRASDAPLASDRFHAGLSFTTALNRFQWTLVGQYVGAIYRDGTVGGAPLGQGARDNTSAGLRARLGYEVSPLTTIFAEGGVERRVYPHSERDSKTLRAVGGLKIEASRLVNGEIHAGYLARRYDAAALSGVATWTIGANLTWLASPLLTIDLISERYVGEDFSEAIVGPGVTTLAGLRADFEASRRLLLRGQVQHEWFSGRATGRRDRVWRGKIAAIYSLSRTIQLALDYTLTERASNVEAFDYRRNRMGASVRAQF